MYCTCDRTFFGHYGGFLYLEKKFKTEINERMKEEPEIQKKKCDS